MPTILKTKNSVTATNAPSSLQQGELAVNITDKKVWVGNAATTPVQLLGDGGSASFTSIAFGAGTVSLPSITTTGDTNTGIFFPAADTIAFTEGGVESMRIDSSGSVGIGTTSNFGKLTVNSTGFGTPLTALTIGDITTIANPVGIYLRSSGTSPSVITTAGSPIAFAGGSTGSPEWMRITSTGDVGIGTSSPAVPLDVNGRIRTRGGSNFLDLYHTGSVAYLETTGGTNTPLGFATAGTERMRIDSAGRVGIGTNSPNANGVFTVSQSTTGTTSDGIRLVQTNTGQSGITLQRTGGTASEWLMYQPQGSTQLRFFGGSGDRVIFSTNGNVGINATPVAAISAYTATNALATLMFSGNNGRMLGKFSANGGVAGKTFNLLTVDNWYSVNSRIFVNVKVMWVDPISDQGNTAVAWAGASQGGTRTQGSFTTTLVWTNSGVGSLSWSGNTLRLTTPSTAIFACCSIDVEFVAFDGAAVTFDVSNQ
jgi:hypothetical protein